MEVKRTIRGRIAATLAALVVAGSLIAAPSPARASSCWPAGFSVWDSYMSRWLPMTYCPTWITANVMDSTDASAYVGVLYPATNWFYCQKSGQGNPRHGGYINRYWLYTQADSWVKNNGWGWFPATAVSYGENNAPVPGVPICPAGFRPI